ncbi:MAG: translocation/assembly module TamB domain-containing protein [Pyrinomonadaceae bacterium]
MTEENINQAEEPEEVQPPETDAQTTVSKRRFFTRRNALIALLLTVISAVLFVVLTTVSYRYGVFDNYVKAQFVAALDEMNITFDADDFRVTVAPLQLELKNATFNNKITGEKLFRIGDAKLGMTVQDLYALQLERHIKVQSTDVTDIEVWVTFDANGDSNFSQVQLIEPTRSVKFNYASTTFSLKNGLVHFGDATRKITGDAKNVLLTFEPENFDVPDDQKRYKFDFTSTDSNFIYDESKVEPVDIRAQGIANGQGAEITNLNLTSPLGTSNLKGTINDWKSPKYDLQIDSTVDLTQTSTIFPLGTPLRGLGDFSGKVTGEGENYKVDGSITSDAISASNIYLKALNINATVDGKGSAYDLNGKAIAELLTFEDFRIDFPQLVGNIRGTGTDFKWLGDLQAAAVKSPAGSIGKLYITDATAEYNGESERLDATLGNVRAASFVNKDIDIANLRAGNVKVSKFGDDINISAPNAQAAKVNAEGATIQNVTANNLRVKNRNGQTNAVADSVRAGQVETKDARLRNLTANNIRVDDNDNRTNVTANNFRADGIDTNGAKIGALNAANVEVNKVGDETVIYSNNLQVARVETNAAILGKLNIAGVRLSIRQGTIEARSGDINAGNIALVKSSSVPEGGNLQNVKIYKPVFVLEPSGRYRATADLSLGSGVLGSIKLGAAKANVNLNNDQVALNNLTADVLEGSVNGAATIAFNNRARSVINADFTNLDLGKLLALQGGKVVPIEGQTSGNVNLSFNGTNFKTASGNLSADIIANAGTQDKGLVPVNGRVEASATNGLFNLDVARFNTQSTELNATGKLDLNGSDSDLNIALASTDASEVSRIISVLDVSPTFDQKINEYRAEFAGNLKFNGTLTGNFSDPTIDGKASLDSLSLRGRELGALSTDVFVSPAGTELKNGLLQERDGGNLAFNVNIPTGGTNNIAVQAELKNVNTGNLLAALPLEGVLPAQFNNFQAQTSGTINLTGLPGEMQGEANITSGAGTLNGEPFDGFDSRVTFAGTLVNVEKFNAKFGEGNLQANGTYDTASSVFDFDVKGENVDLTRVRPFLPNNQNLPAFSGNVNLTAKATGDLDDSKTFNVNFNGTGQNIAFADKNLGVITFNGNTENQRLNANITANFEGQPPQTIAANVNFADPNLPFEAETVFDNTNLAPFIALAGAPGTVAVTGTATGRVFLRGNLSGINANGEREFTTDNLSGSAEFSQLALQIDETPLIASEPVSVKFNTREVVIESAKFSGSGSNITVAGTKALTDDGINNLSVDGTINLRILNAISPNAFFAGLASVSIRLTGPNSTARLNGDANFQNASISAFVGSERVSFQRVEGRVLFTSNQAQIDNLTGFLGGGRFTASGGALLDGLTLQAFRLDLRGNNVTVPLPKNFLTTGDAEIGINGRRIGGELTTLISGRLNARRSLYSKDIDLADVIGSRSDGSLTQGSSSGNSLGITRLDLLVEGRDALVVRNNIADLTASISLRVTGDIDYPQVAGRITATNGTLFFRSDRYEVQRAELVFPPNSSGIEPVINLQAETEIGGYQILVNLNGPLTDTESLVANVRSNPSLPQPDVISLITTGSISNSSTGIPTLAQSGISTAAEILTDEIINKPIAKATDKLFGLNKFELDPIISGQRLNPTARLTVGRQINKNLLVTYSTNLSEDQNQVLAFEYRVSNKLSFVAQYEQRSLSNVTRNRNNFSFEVRLRKRF